MNFRRFGNTAGWGTSKLLLSLILLAIGSGTAALQAAPNIQSISGVVDHQTTVVINGSGFGSKPGAAPMKWDDFEGGSHGSNLNGWILYSSGGPEPRYTSAVTRTGSTRSAWADFTDNYNCSFQQNNGAWETLFISFYYYADYSCNDGGACYEGQATRSHKIMRTEGNNGSLGGDQNEGVPLFNLAKTKSNNGKSHSGLRAQYSPTIIADTHYYGGTWEHEQWKHVKMYIDISPTAPNKVLYYWTDHAEQTREDLFPDELQQMGIGGSKFNEIKFGFYFSNDGGVTANVYFDDVYIDTTLAHVELCNASTWDARTFCELQIPSAWSNNSISITTNQGAFANGQAAYVYVTDAAGNVNASGYQVTLGSGDDPPAGSLPLAPSNLRRDDTR